MKRSMLWQSDQKLNNITLVAEAARAIKFYEGKYKEKVTAIILSKDFSRETIFEASRELRTSLSTEVWILSQHMLVIGQELANDNL